MNILDGTSYIAIFKYIFFLMTAVAQIYMMCLYGNKIIESVRKVIGNISIFLLFKTIFLQSTGVSDSIYEQDWFNAEIRYKKLLILMIARAQKPAMITAYKFSSVSNSSFMTVRFSSVKKFINFKKNKFSLFRS